ncbi:hypothetical protein IAT38_007201 [Cryptococcus sp. DSM 104549]
MLETYRDAQQFIDTAPTLFSSGWKHVASFDEVGESDEWEYETEEEEVYVTMDLGGVLDPKALQSSAQYQLVGLDTPLPFLKVGNQVFQGEVTPLIGEEIICGHIRNIDSHPPMYKTPHRLTFRAVTLEEKLGPRESSHGPSPLPPSASPPPPEHLMEVDADLKVQATPGRSRVRFDKSRSPRGEEVGTLAEATATMGLGSPRATPRATPNAQAGPSRPTPAQASTSGTSGPSALGLTGASDPLDEMPIPETGFAPFLPIPADMRMKKPRKVGSGRQRRVIEDPKEMDGFDVEALTEHQTLSVGPLVLARLNLPIPENGEYAILRKKDIARALNGQSPIRRRKRLPKPSTNIHGTPGGSLAGGEDGDAPSPGPQGPTGQVTMGNQVAHGGEGLSGLGEMTRVIRLPGGAGVVAGATVGRGGPGSRGGRGSRGPRGSRGGRGKGRSGVMAGMAGVGGMGGPEDSTAGSSRGGLSVPGPALALGDAAGRERSGSASGPGALESEEES